MSDERLARMAQCVAGDGVTPSSADYEMARRILAAYDETPPEPTALGECLRTIYREKDLGSPVTFAVALEQERVAFAIRVYGEAVRRAALKAVGA